MLTIPPNQKPKLDRVDRFATLRDYNLALFDAISTADESQQYDLIHRFRVGCESPYRISI